jgi:hypothetical protein
VDALSRSVRQLESAHSEDDLRRIVSLAAGLERHAARLGDDELASVFRRLRRAETLFPSDLAARVAEAVAEGTRAVRWRRVWDVLTTRPAARPVWA